MSTELVCVIVVFGFIALFQAYAAILEWIADRHMKRKYGVEALEEHKKRRRAHTRVGGFGNL